MNILNIKEMEEELIDLTLLAMDIADGKGCTEFATDVICAIWSTGADFPNEADLMHMGSIRLYDTIEKLETFIKFMEKYDPALNDIIKWMGY